MYLCLLMVLVALGSGKANNVLPITAELGTPMGQCPLYDDPSHPILFSVPNDCTKYYSCLKGKAYLKQCDPNLFWSQTNYRCDFIEYSNCKLYPDSQPDYPVQYSPYPGDCTQFIEKRVYSCGENKQWNDVTKSCVPSPLGGCDNGSYSPWIPQYPGGNTDIVPTAATPPTPVGPSGNYLPIDPMAICKTNNQNTFLPYPNDCRKFIHCGPQPIVIECKGQAMYWNAQIQACDKSSAGCQWGQ